MMAGNTPFKGRIQKRKTDSAFDKLAGAGDAIAGAAALSKFGGYDTSMLWLG
jgi:hypothetical protein